MAKEMLNGSGVVIERASFRHCTADATLKMVQASHHCAIAGVSASANEEGALRLRVVAASDSAEHERQSRYGLDLAFCIERQPIILISGLIIFRFNVDHFGCPSLYIFLRDVTSCDV